ncbi:MAG: sensor histidine kinase [Bacteroidota bacterium]
MFPPHPPPTASGSFRRHPQPLRGACQPSSPPWCLAQAPLFGFQTAAERFNFWWTLPVIFVGSLLFSFSCLCLGLYLIFRDRAALVYAALFSLVGLLRLLVSDAMPIRFLSTELPLNLVMSLRFLALPYLTFFAGLYVLEFIPQRTTKCFRRFLWWSVSSISGLVLLLPPFPKSYVIYLTQLFIVLTIAFLLWLLLRRSNADNRELRIILFTGILTAVFVLAQVVNFYGNYSARSTQTYGLLVLAGGMGLMALRDVRRLNGERALLTGELQVANTELSQLTRSLESKVAHRTQELAKRNRELETLQRFRQRTNAMIIHDLKNPLQVILSRAGATEGTDGRIRTAGQRMLLMIQNMLDVDRAEQARLTVRPETFLLGDLVRDAVDRQRSFLEQKEISVKVEIPATAKIRSDRNLTERAVDNILHNATKYTPGKGVIRLHVRPEEHFLALYCDDSGPGVPIALREQIFTDYASDRGRSDAYGLGLSFVRIALEAVGGRVAVGTPENGTGGRFVLYFPAAGEAFVQAITLDEQDREVLAPFLPTLRATPFYSATAIEVLLGEIPDVGGLPGWKGALREAMYAGDEDKYLGLLEK